MRPPKMLKSVFLVASFVLFFQGISRIFRGFSFEWSVCNAAGPFGISLEPFLLHTIIVVVLTTVMIVWWGKRSLPYSFIWLILFSAGLSNMLERVLHGCVFDYILLPWWPTFNIADTTLFVSVVFLVWKEYTSRE